MRQLAFLSLAAIACGGAEIQPPVTPKNAADHIREGDLGSALDACRRGDCNADQKLEVARMAVVQKKPQLDVHVLSEDEVFARYGGRVTRHVLRQHFAIDVKVTAPGFDLPKVSILPEGDHGKLATVIRDPEHFTVLTGEHYPAPHEWQEWAVMDVPYPKVEGLGTLALAAAEVMIVGPIQLLTLHRETRTRPPTDEEVRAAVPLAVKLIESSKQTFFVARPLADEPLTLHSAINLGIGASTIGVHYDLPLAGKDAHADLANANEVALSALPDERCDPPCMLAPLGPARTITIGLTIPEVPKDLGTPDARDKSKPYWTSSTYAPERLFAGPAAAKDEEGRLVVCTMKTIDVPGEDADDVYANVTIGKKTYYKRIPRSFMSFPLVRVAPGGTWSISLWDVDMLSGDDWLSTVSFRRSGANVARVVSPKYAETDLACTVHARPAIENEFMTRWIAANDDLETMDRIVRIDLGKKQFGLERRSSTIDAIEGMAALVGWDDPRVKPLVERMAVHERNFGIATKSALDGWSKEHPSADLKVNGMRCGKDVKLSPQDHPEYKHTKCVVDIEMVPGTTLRNVRIVMTDGRAVDVDYANANRTLIPRNIPAIGENEKPWAVAFDSKTLGVVLVP